MSEPHPEDPDNHSESDGEAPKQKPRKDSTKTPQQLVAAFWDNYITKAPGKVTSIFPPRLYANLLPPIPARGASVARNAAESYELAAKQCREKVRRIVRECHLRNEKFTDAEFDLEADNKLGIKNCLLPLVRSDGEKSDSGGGDDDDDDDESDAGDEAAGFSGSVHRVDWIYESPQFVIDGFSTSDIMQGRTGDCWWLAAVATMCSKNGLLERICVARDEECGVYGFVFCRDGEWISTVIDDNLYLKEPDFDMAGGGTYDAAGKRTREYKRRYQTGSEALYFAKCANANETWLPLLEKAFAKVHGDYEAISGGYPGEGVEDMTGGVTHTIMTSRVLSKNRLWNDLIDTRGEFVFAASAISMGEAWKNNGLALGHAYSILRAAEERDGEGNTVRLVLLRNPWGERGSDGVGEWSGPWSDGSREWTPYWMNKLNHRFGDDGLFWMSYEDLLSHFMFLHRTRLFDDQWTVVQQWTNVNVSWVTGYMQSKFVVEIKQSGPTIFVMSQLDDRYFRGLEGQYQFDLHFILQQQGAEAGDHIVRVRPPSEFENRSVSAEVDLEPGVYEVIPRIHATRNKETAMVDDVIREWADKNPQKLRQMGMNYDLAHAKAGLGDEEQIRKMKEEQKKKKKQSLKKKQQEMEKAQQEKEKRQQEKERRQREKERKHHEKEKKERNEEQKREKIKRKRRGKGNRNRKGRNRQDEPSDDDSDTNKAESLSLSTLSIGSNTPDSSDTSSGEDEGRDGVSSIKTSRGNRKQKKRGSRKDHDSDGESEDNESNADESGSDSDDNNESDGDSDNKVVDEKEKEENPWNAVCVFGLRVYAKDPELTIKLVKPGLEEGSLLNGDGISAAGATM